MRPARKTRYLLRFDDLCPTMNWTAWSEIEAALVEQELKPLLAVVPDNQDPVLKVDTAVGDFWDRVRKWEGRGWTIALHGFQHRWVAEHAGIVTRRDKTEFAGIRADLQEEKLRRGVDIFERQKLRPRVWIAPKHSFDATTVNLLSRLGFQIICDGYFRYPFVAGDMLWVPQQLFCFRPAPPGVWTVCFHHNHWTAEVIAKFREDLKRYRSQISSLEEVLPEWGDNTSRLSEFMCTSPRLSEFLIRCQLKLWGWWSSQNRQNISGSLRRRAFHLRMGEGDRS
jgi:predicted deacetylase